MGAPGAIIYVVGNLAAFYVAMLAATALHQLASALAGRGLGLSVRELTIGYGPLLIRGRLGELPLALRAWPFSGMCSLMSAPRPYLALRVAIAHAAGPIACALVAVFILWIGDLDPVRAFFPRSLAHGWYVAELTYTMLVLIAALCLVPTGTIWRVVAIARHPARHVEPIIALHYLQRASDAVEPSPAVALAPIEEGLRHAPENRILAITRAGLLVSAKDYPAAHAALAALRDLHGFPPATVAQVENYRAWTCLALGGEYLREADEASAQALQLDPFRASCLHTRGAVLVELGQLERGRDMLASAVRARVDDKHIAHDHTWLAIVEARLGNAEAARDQLASAIAADPDVEHLERARAAVAALPT